jgi:hypothetical protein
MFARKSSPFITFALRAAVLSALASSPALALNTSNRAIRVEVSEPGPASVETILVKVGDAWVPALSATTSSVHVTTPTGMKVCAFTAASEVEGGILLKGDCGVGKYEQRVMFSAADDVLNITTRMVIAGQSVVNAMEDRYDFMPERHKNIDVLNGPLDFVWSQNIKREITDVVATPDFKSPVVMMQQGEIFAALIPHLNDHVAEPLALDLDVTSDKHPWISYGSVPSEPQGHSYYRRVANGQAKTVGHQFLYSYTITVSRQPVKLGYRRVVRDLWAEYGHRALAESPDMQQDVIRPELTSFSSWQQEAWHTYADRIYSGWDCGGKRCGTLASFRTVSGDWAHPETNPDAWFNAWFQTLRTAYGWYLRGRETNDKEMMAKADSVLNLALSAPQKEGAFPTIYVSGANKWYADDGWAGYVDDYHSFCMSWTAYWMLKWATDLEPERKAEVMHFVEPYAKFLLKHQLKSGVIPSWYDSSFTPREDFRDFNGETGASALFLAYLGSLNGDQQDIAAAERAMNFVTEQVVPRQRWFDFETYLSCARKPYDFFDTWTAQYPQNNLAEIQTVQAWLQLYQTTHKQVYLDRGTAGLDYLLLTQQVWNNPLFTPKLLGGFTTQNTDAEWSDARQGYAAPLLFDYYRATGNFEYLERSIAAARSTLAVAPWENWAHNGHPDGPGALTGFHWGPGSAMTAVQMMLPSLGDAYIDLKARGGVGFDECSVTDVLVNADTISFQIDSLDRQRKFNVHFANVDSSRQYLVSWNGKPAKKIAGKDLIANGLSVGPL